MPELLRTIVGRLREIAGDRRYAYRHRVKVPCSVSIHYFAEQANGRRPVPAMQGHTRDISATGVGLIVPAIRIGEHYLTGEDRLLKIVLELPSGSIQIILTPVRYEPIDNDEDEQGFVIGGRITEISPQDRDRLKTFLKSKK
jgi:c-di-GMP-binding flagellar brake protein YcgR